MGRIIRNNGGGGAGAAPALSKPPAIPTSIAGLDMTILSSIPKPDPDAKRKYDAMGLPDPVAFAALVALGTIPDPMGMLNSMMARAQSRSEVDSSLSGDLADAPLAKQGRSLPGLPVPHAQQGNSYADAYWESQREVADKEGAIANFAKAREVEIAEGRRCEERTARQARDTADQVKLTAERAREANSHAMAAAPPLAEGGGMNIGGQIATPAHGTQFVSPMPGTTMAVPRSVAQFFAAPGGMEDEDDGGGGGHQPAKPAKPQPITLSSLLTGVAAANGAFAAAEAQHGMSVSAPGSSGVLDKICITRLPSAVTDASIRLECARHGAVTSSILQADGLAAYVTFASVEMAATAVRRIGGRVGLFGGAAPVDVKQVGELPEHLKITAAWLPGELPIVEQGPPVDPRDLPEHLRPHGKNDDKRGKEKKNKDRKRSKSKNKKKKRSRSNWLARSRSNSHTATGQYIRATGCSSTVKWWEKKRQSSSASSRSEPRPQRRYRSLDRGQGGPRAKPREALALMGAFVELPPEPEPAPPPPAEKPPPPRERPTQIAVKGTWAQFVLGPAGAPPYYFNLATGDTTWERPPDFDAGSGPGRRSEGASAGPARPTGCRL